MKSLRRTRGGGCLSDLALDRLVCGESSQADERRARVHIETCARCRERRAAIVADQKEFSTTRGASAPNFTVRKRRARVVPFRYVGPASAALALAAGVLIWLRARSADVEEYGTRLKGGGRLSFFVARGEDTHRGSAGEVLRAGDRVQFVVALTEPRHVAVLSRDGRGSASVFFPQAPRAERVDAGPAVRLPSSTALDDAPDREDVYGLLCRSAVELEPIRAELQSSGRLSPPPDCEVDSIHWLKEPRR